MPKHLNIPLLTRLVAPGNPHLKAAAQQNSQLPSHIEELNMRIDEIETAIGQTNNGPIGRAYAIRAEENHTKTNHLNDGLEELESEQGLLFQTIEGIEK